MQLNGGGGGGPAALASSVTRPARSATKPATNTITRTTASRARELTPRIPGNPRSPTPDDNRCEPSTTTIIPTAPAPK